MKFNAEAEYFNQPRRSRLSSLIEQAREGARATVARRKSKRKFETFLQTSDVVVNPRPRGIRLCRLRHATSELSHGAEDGDMHLRRRNVLRCMGRLLIGEETTAFREEMR